MLIFRANVWQQNMLCLIKQSIQSSRIPFSANSQFGLCGTIRPNRTQVWLTTMTHPQELHKIHTFPAEEEIVDQCKDEHNAFHGILQMAYDFLPFK
jgi:hypothetical protein